MPPSLVLSLSIVISNVDIAEFAALVFYRKKHKPAYLYCSLNPGTIYNSDYVGSEWCFARGNQHHIPV